MKKLKRDQKLPVQLLGLAFLVSITIAVIYIFIRKHNSPQERIEYFSEALNERYVHNKVLLDNIAQRFDSLDFQSLHTYSKKLPPGLTLFAFHDSALIYWSDNTTPHPLLKDNDRIVYTANGIFQQSRITDDTSYTIVLFDLIKHNYPYNNDYLSSSYNPTYDLPDDYKISPNMGNFAVRSTDGNILFHISAKDKPQLSGEQEFVLFSLYLLVIVLALFAFYNFLKSLKIDKYKALLIIVLSTIMLRLLFFLGHVPKFFQDFDFFSPVNYASSFWLPSLGDLLINVVLITILSFLTYKVLRNINLQITKLTLKISLSILAIAAINLLFYLCLFIIDTLIMNSSFELNLTKILDFSVYSLVAYLVIAMILLTLFYLSFIGIKIGIASTGGLKFFALFIILSSLTWFILQKNSYYTPLWQELAIFYLFIFVASLIIKNILPFPHVATTSLVILILSVISTFCLYHNKEGKEKEERKLMALRLSTDQDKVAEYLYQDLEKEILVDTALINKVVKAWYNPKIESEIADYIHSTYFSGYWSKYNAQITVCYPDKQLSLKPSDVIIDCNTYFDRIIKNLTEKTASSTLYYIKESFGGNSYISRIPIKHKLFTKNSPNIVIEFTQKYVPKGLGYPELLLDKSFVTFYDMSIYSYAIYSRGELIKNVGDYSYSISEKPFAAYKSEFNFFDKNNYNHLYHIINKDTALIISKKNLNLLDKLAPFTYQLIFHIILIFIITTVYNFRTGNKRYPDLKSQLQIMLVALVLFASILIGAITLHNIKSLNNKKNQDMLSEKAHSVLIEIEHKLDNFNYLDSSQQYYLQELLTKFSLVFFSDINLYTIDGKILATSRPEIFEEGLRSEFMSPEAYNQISVNQRTFFVTNEQIGSYQYISAYIPFRNRQNELIAYVNLPFFAREHELRQEISSFLVTFVNIYIILTAIAVFISLLVGNYLTRPLQLIRDKFSNVKLDKRNEKITYNRQDELGNLINEYNIMLDKLSDSVDKLAQSERENAWKEMARQIAHEIKNPLTPMKLSIQHLYRSWKDKAPDWETRLEKTTTSVIQQIDSLAAIATAFSDFAKFPAPTNEKIEITTLIKDTIELFLTQNNFTISFTHPQTPCYIFADKKQLTRVLVNLLNNAIQSIPVERQGKIEIIIQSELTHHVIYVKDNGIGIPPEQWSKIFSPNFTTKSGGAGLGLAMVKNIIDSANGRITFSSSPGGTTFEIQLPVYL